MSNAPTNLGDVGTLPTLPAGQYYSVTGISVARLNGGTAGSFDVGYFLWNTVDTTSTTSIFSNLLISGSFNRVSTAANIGQVFTTAITFTTPVVMQGGQTFGYQMEYAVAGSINLATAAYTPNTLGSSGYLVDHGTTTNTGTSPDTFYLDANNDGKFVATDSTATTNTGFNNVYLVINANIVPEPTTNAALACGGLVLLGGWQLRRRSASGRA